MKGYKVFNPDWTCRGFQYEVGETYHMEEEIKCGIRGFHFSEKLLGCFRWYVFAPQNKVAEVEALGEISTCGDSLYCTNTIKIMKELSWEEVLGLVNVGVGNTGFGNTSNHNSGNYNSGENNIGGRNTGNHNYGNCNSGDWNYGNWNSGSHNLGDYNSGDHNSGDRNSGNGNSGNWNCGNYNSGDFNCGDWNCGDGNVGFFNTESPKVTMFDAPTDWTLDNWVESIAYSIMACAPFDRSERQQWWDCLGDRERGAVMSLPNFDADKFEKCTGIKVKQS